MTKVKTENQEKINIKRKNKLINKKTNKRKQ